MTKNCGYRNFILPFVVLFTILSLSTLGMSVSLKSDGGVLFVAHSNGTFELWNTTSGSIVKSFSKDITLVTFEKDGEIFYFGSDYGVIVSDLGGNTLEDLNLSRGTIFALAVDKNYLYAGSEDAFISIWDVNNWSLVKAVKGHETAVSVLFLDDKHIYSASADGSVKVWDRQNMLLLKNLTTHSNWISAKSDGYSIWHMVVYGDRIYTGHVNGNIRIWDLNNDSLVKEIQAHHYPVAGLVTDGEYIYSCGSSKDRTLKVWTLEGDLKTLLDIETYSPTGLAVDANRVYLGVREGGVLVYNKTDLNLTWALGTFAGPTSEGDFISTAKQTKLNPALPVFIALSLFVAAAIVLETYAGLKRNAARKQRPRNLLVSFVSIEDVLKILFAYLIIMFLAGSANPFLVAPNYIPNIKAIYYFDMFVRKGALLPLWFLLPASIAYWVAKRYKIKYRYLACIITEVAAFIIYVVAPSVT